MIDVLDRFATGPAQQQTDANPEVEYQRIKQRVHEQIVATLEIATASQLTLDELGRELRPFH